MPPETNSFDNIRQILAMLSQIPGVGPWVNDLVNLVMGRAPFGLNWMTINRDKSLVWNVEAAQRSRFMQHYMQPGHNYAADVVMQNFMTNLYGMAGYTRDEAAAAAQKALDSPIAPIAKMFIAPQLDAAYASVGGAFYRRFAAGQGASADQKNIYRRLGQFYRDFVTDAATGTFASLDIGDSGKLLGELVNSGAFESEGTTVEGFDRRAKKLKRELVSYAHSVGVLKDIINGPIEQILQEFEALTGNKLTSMSVGRAEMAVGSMRQAMFGAGVSLSDIERHTATQYALIAPYGGTLDQARAMATATATAVKSGYRIEGLSEIHLGQLIAQDNANKLVNGQTRQLAAAYQHWRLGKNMEDNQLTFEQFRRQMGADLYGGASKYLAENNVSASFMSSQLVTNTMGNTEFFTGMRAQQYNVYQDRIKGLNLAKNIQNILLNERDPSRMLERLQAAGLSSDAAAQLVSQVQGIAMDAFGIYDELGAMGMVATAANADRIQRQKAGGLALYHVRGMGFGKSGWEGVIDNLAKNPGMVAKDLSSLLSSLFGVNVDQSDIIAKLHGKDKAEIKASLKALGVDPEAFEIATSSRFAQSNVIETILTAESKINEKGENELDPDKLLARRIAVVTALKNKKITRQELVKMTEGIDFTDQQLDEIYLTAKKGSSVDKRELDKFTEYRKAELETTKARLRKKYAEDIKNAGNDQAKLKEINERINEEASGISYDLASNKLFATQAGKILKLTGENGRQLTADEAAKSVLKGEGDLQKSILERAKTAYKTTTGKEWGAGQSEDQQLEFIKNFAFQSGGMEDLISQLLELVQNLIRSLDANTRSKK